MKKIATILLFCFSQFGLAQSSTSNQNFGLGIMLGEVTGLTTNYFVKPNHSFDGGLSLDSDEDLEIYLTHLWHYPNSLVFADEISLGWYWGLGPKLIINEENGKDLRKFDDDSDDILIGPRAVIGLNHTFDPPVEIFGQLSSTLYVIEDTDLDIDASIGARFYF